MKNLILFVFILCFACSSKLMVPIIGTWRCELVERIERPERQNIASSLGQELAASEKVSDSIVFRNDNIYEEFNSAFGIHNQIKGIYFFSPSDRNLLLTKNIDAPGLEKSKQFSITKLTNDTLILNDTKGFKFVYLRLKTK